MSIKQRDLFKKEGGIRSGAGRPKDSKNAIPTKQIRVPVDIAEWLNILKQLHT